MAAHRFGAILRLVGEAARVEVEFGTQSLETLARIADAVASSVYVPDSLTRTPTGLALRLANPPLRVGAFAALRLFVDGHPVPAEDVRFRTATSSTWRTAASVRTESPLDLQAGDAIDLAADLPDVPRVGPVTIRLELQSVAIPPLVWFEVRDRLRDGGAP